MSATVPSQNPVLTVDPPRRSPMIGGRMDGAVQAHQCGEVVVLEPLGRLDRSGVEQVRDAVRAFTGRPIVIDLSDCILTKPIALADLAHDGGDALDLCFISRRPTCRLLLARTGITSYFAVFSQLEDALQARTFANAGYGHGWRRP